MQLAQDISFIILVVVAGWHIIGIPPVMYWRKERRVKALAAILAIPLETMTDSSGYIHVNKDTVRELAERLDGRLNPWS